LVILQYCRCPGMSNVEILVHEERIVGVSTVLEDKNYMMLLLAYNNILGKCCQRRLKHHGQYAVHDW
jgi:hypothetical protein